MNNKSYQIRIFLTCWIIFSLHFATDFVREHYLVQSIADDFSFRLDGYEDMHPDIFVTENHGAHHGANPGASMIAAIPYVILKPLVDVINNKVLEKRAHEGKKITAVYRDHRPGRVKFYKQVRERGLDVKFALIGFITQVFCMAIISAISAMLIFNIFIWLGQTARLSTWLALLYAIGTPVLFRTGFLNQNLMVGIFALFAFVLIWRPYASAKLSERASLGWAGFFTGIGLLCDYSGVIPMAILGIYALVKRSQSVGFNAGLRDSLWYGYGNIPGILLLWLYQYRSFGNPFFPGQHYMPPVEFSDQGYQGFTLPDLEIIELLLFNPHFGLFIAGPIMILSLFALLPMRNGQIIIPKRETVVILALFLATLIFFSAVQYSRIQSFTGIRYMMAVVPTLYILSAVVLIQLPKILAYPLALVSLIVSISMGMVRSQVSVTDSIMRVFLEGFQLPWLNTLSKMATQYVPHLDGQRISAIPFLVLSAILIYWVWTVRKPLSALRDDIKN